MQADCHIHMVLDGLDWKSALARHKIAPDDGFIHAALQRYQTLGYRYLRDGGDRWGAGKRARELSSGYGITYRTPLAPLCRVGCYGSFIGATYETMKEYAQLVVRARQEGADFIKIMISGIMDFDVFGSLIKEAPPVDTIGQLVHIAHEEGMAVMAHGNGAAPVLEAARAGVDSIEHGAYLSEEALQAMVQAGTVWVPTLSTIGNLRGKGRFREEAVEQILESALENVNRFLGLGGIVAPGTDAGAWAVPHGSVTECGLLFQAGATREDLQRGITAIMGKF